MEQLNKWEVVYKSDALNTLQNVKNVSELNQWKVDVLGKKGSLKNAMEKALVGIDQSRERLLIGNFFLKIRNEFETALKAQEENLV
jgi:hypothetical protein